MPASDRPTIGALHADMARLRSRSIGAAMIRPARPDISTITNTYRRSISEADHRHGADLILKGSLPKTTRSE